jgi:Short C-terminal domain
VLAYLDIDSGPSAGAIVGVVLVISVIYFAICWWIARYAESKGQSFLGFLLLGVLVSPIISLIVALVIDDHALRPAGGDRLDQLQKLTELRDAGSLSPEEFEAEKARILAEQA